MATSLASKSMLPVDVPSKSSVNVPAMSDSAKVRTAWTSMVKSPGVRSWLPATSSVTTMRGFTPSSSVSSNSTRPTLPRTPQNSTVHS